MILKFAEAADALDDLVDGLPVEEIAEHYPWDTVHLASNSIHGTMYEEKWRGEFRSFPEDQWNSIVRKTVQRLRLLPVLAAPIECRKPLALRSSTAGWGSYKWNYDLRLPTAAIHLGASIIDTAETYGYGRVEQDLGFVLSRVDSLKTLIATKVSRSHMRRQAVLNAAQRSAKKLRVPIGLYQIHWPNPDVAIEETMVAMKTLVEAGTVGAVGVCNFSIDQLYSAQRIYPHIASIQLRCAPEDQEDLLQEVLPYCREANIQIIAHSPFGQGSVELNHNDRIQQLRTLGIVPIPGTNSLDHLAENLQ